MTIHKTPWEKKEKIKKKYNKKLDAISAKIKELERNQIDVEKQMCTELDAIRQTLCGLHTGSVSGGYGVTCKRCTTISRKNGWLATTKESK